MVADLLASGPKPDFKKALAVHTQALQLADPLSSDPHPAIRAGGEGGADRRLSWRRTRHCLGRVEGQAEGGGAMVGAGQSGGRRRGRQRRRQPGAALPRTRPGAGRLRRLARRHRPGARRQGTDRGGREAHRRGPRPRPQSPAAMGAWHGALRRRADLPDAVRVGQRPEVRRSRRRTPGPRHQGKTVEHFDASCSGDCTSAWVRSTR